MGRQLGLRCFLMGTGSRLIQCGEIWLAKEHRILGVISAKSEVQRWAKQKNLRVILPSADLAHEMASEPFDYFFSIDNPSKIAPELRSLPRRLAINFHDAPLPRYAGLNATNWAIMGGEKTHGITWHVMSDKIDAGDILKTVTFSISDRETALTLNAKCYEKSIEAFTELVDDLTEDRVIPVKQNLDNRTYFPGWRRPPAACTIDWKLSAEEIDALVRSLDYGPYPNPMGLPKLYLADNLVIVQGTEILPTISTAAPGTITGITDQGLRIATSTKELLLTAFSSPGGERLLPASLPITPGLQVGMQMPQLAHELSHSITRVYSTFCRHESYWAERLLDLEVLELPYRKSLPARGGAAEGQLVHSSFAAKVPGDTHLAAVALYLSLLAGKEHFDVGFRDVILERELSGMEAYFASHVPLRIDAGSDETFGEYYRRIHHHIKVAREHGSYARDLVLRDPRLREASKRVGVLSLGVLLERVQNANEQRPLTNADLAIVIPDDGREIRWWYKPDIYDGEAIGRMQEQYEVLLDGIASGHDRPISDLTILTDKEAGMIETWNDSQFDYPKDMLLHQLFEAQVKRTPEKVAVSCTSGVLSYSQLDKRANQLARHLNRLGVAPNSFVGVCMERSLEMVVALYAVLKAGGAYVPIDPEYPPERIAFMLADSEVPVLLTQSRLTDRVSLEKGQILSLDSEWESIARESTDKLPDEVDAESLAYMIYTSGSTGRPKGAMNTHHGICNRLLWMQDRYKLTAADKVLQKTPSSFDVSVWEFFWPLMAGARLVLAEPGGHRDAGYLVKLINDQEITVLHFVPSMLNIFLQEPGVESCGSLRQVICSGEALPFNLQELFFRKVSAPLDNLYGPTEAAVDVTYWACQRDDARRIVPIGRPVANTQIRILDQHLHQVPVGVPGELHIGGVQVGRGYHRRPELTAERFITDPFGSCPERKLYKTGDLARWLPDGNIEYLGRMDSQVKIRGLRLELGEIESVIEGHPDVKQCLAAVREDVPEEKIIVAYIVWRQSDGHSVEQLRDYLKRKLPDYMVPSVFVGLDEIPMTPNGKVDRRALPSPSPNELFGKRTVETPPKSYVEKEIAAIWQEELGVTEVGTDVNFFDLGGDSLRLMKVRVRLRKVLNADLSMLDLLKWTTIQSLAIHLQDHRGDLASSQQDPDAIEARKNAAAHRRQLRRRLLNGHESSTNEPTAQH